MKKNLLFTLIVFLIGSGVGYAQTFKIGNLEVMKEDLGKMKWEEAKQACADLGDGWRLPTKEELNKMYLKRKDFDGFTTVFYWSSSTTVDGIPFGQSFGTGRQAKVLKDKPMLVRPVRDLPTK